MFRVYNKRDIFDDNLLDNISLFQKVRNIPRANRLCCKCTTGMIGDEFHYLFICQCKEVVEIRNKFIPNYYINNPK
jgi:hypothetical protein